MRVKLKLLEGGQLPPGYGLAYYDYLRDEAIALPLGLHWLVGFWVLWLWPRLAGPLLRANIESRAYQTGYQRGRVSGFKQGFEAGRADVLADIEKSFDENK